MKIPRRLLKILAFLLPIAGGAFIFWLLASGKAPPERRTGPPPPRSVRVVTVEAQDVVPRILGYGLVEPARTWSGIAQVAGRIVEKSELLEDGRGVLSGSVLAKIDRREYELKVLELEASLREVDARLTQLDTRQANVRATLDIEERALAFFENEVERQRQLLESEAGSEAAFEQQQRSYLQQLNRVQELHNTLTLVPVEHRTLDATRAATAARLEAARLDLEYTEIRAPFDCRVGEVNVELSQYVKVGDVLCRTYDVSAAEIHAQVPLSRMKSIFGDLRGEPIEFSKLASVTWVEQLGIRATVRLRLGDSMVSWDGRLSRLGSQLDPRTRTLEAVVTVDDPYGQARLGQRPPLVPGMYCEVELAGQANAGSVLLPRSALHGDEVYLVEDGRLARRTVRVGLSMGDFLVVEDGLSGGETLIVSDPVPAIAGTIVAPMFDEELTLAIARVASGKAEIR